MGMTDYFLENTHLGRSILNDRKKKPVPVCGKSLIEYEARYWNKKIADRNNLRAECMPNNNVSNYSLRSHRNEILGRIAKRRGEAGADKLRREMERQWPLSF